MGRADFQFVGDVSPQRHRLEDVRAAAGGDGDFGISGGRWESTGDIVGAGEHEGGEEK